MSDEIPDDLDLETDVLPQEGLETIESKYKDQMRQIVTQKLELPITSLPDMLRPKTGQINLSPDFQRRSIWDNIRRSRFIESVIMNIPIPPVFLGEVDYAAYAVLDGRQRLTAIHEFMRNSFKLSKLEVWRELNGKTFADLQNEGLDKFFIRRFIPAVIVLRESSPQVKYDVFDRLNTGGIVAVPMEIRNAVFPGEFNSLLHEITSKPPFTTLWNIPEEGKPGRSLNKIYARMDDLELALRFFAVPQYAGRMMFSDFLSDFMQQKNLEYKAGPKKAEKDRALFLRAHTNALRVFGTEAFRRPISATRRKLNRSAPLADAVLAALSGVDTDKITPAVAKSVRAGFDKLILEDVAFQASITSGTNGKGAITTRIRMAKDIVDKVLRSAR